MSFDKLYFGTAGIPLSTKDPTTIEGIKRVAELGLGGMELEFVHNVNLSERSAPLVKKAALDVGVNLTCHGQYYINLNAEEKEKMDASRERVIHAARIAALAGAKSMTFHAGFYVGETPKKTFDDIKEQFEIILGEMKKQKIAITIRPETTGKGTQFGSLEELLKLCSELDNVLPCIDFSHLHARSNGKYNTYKEFCNVLEQSKSALGKDFLNNLHCHVSGIEYTAKGERRHLPLEKSDFNYKDLMKALAGFDCKGVIVCESPIIEEDALLMKKTFESFK
ncbi:MAG: TIM barrel protein [archaeon]